MATRKSVNAADVGRSPSTMMRSMRLRHSPRVISSKVVRRPTNPLRDVLNQWSPVKPRTSPRSARLSKQFPALEVTKPNNLLVFFEKKIHDFTRENEEFLEELQRLESCIGSHVDFNRQLSEKDQVISNLKKILGDVEAALNQEREHAARMRSENGTLRIEMALNEKKLEFFSSLLSFGPGSKNSIRVTEINPDRMKLLRKDSKRPKHQSDEPLTAGGTSPTVAQRMEVDALRAKIDLLQNQLEQQSRLTHAQIAALHLEREDWLREKEEVAKRNQRDRDRILSRLKETQLRLTETLRNQLEKRSEAREDTFSYVLSRVRSTGTSTAMPTRVSSSGSSGRRGEVLEQEECKKCPQLETQVQDLRNRVQKLKDSLTESEAEISLFRDQVLARERDLAEAHALWQKEQEKNKLKAERLKSDLVRTRRSQKEMDRRRRLEAEGFRTELTHLKKQLGNTEDELHWQTEAPKSTISIAVSDSPSRAEPSVTEAETRRKRRPIVRQYRETLPAQQITGPTSVWSFLRHAIGKDLSKVSMPVTYNEPLSILQRMAESTEYIEILYRAAFAAESVARMESRMLLEQVSHHPPISAFNFESKEFLIYGSATPRLKFRGMSIEVEPMGFYTLYLKEEEYERSLTAGGWVMNNAGLEATLKFHAAAEGPEYLDFVDGTIHPLRFRPDIRKLEEGDIEAAKIEKERLEIKQRDRISKREAKPFPDQLASPQKRVTILFVGGSQDGGIQCYTWMNGSAMESTGNGTGAFHPTFIEAL
ncbi:unnamed protein product [Cyprideis torosa]|uniref:Oxysterol-binding protein n=1 Tax=Cyprideis torosa TaxID=163714 RepID=A0A7R8WE83_9CRUS|nr:unnamed protein product [Cyprideis torosa]CAG0890410.1 unnamed protein product [Cyprideis torosa]